MHYHRGIAQRGSVQIDTTCWKLRVEKVLSNIPLRLSVFLVAGCKDSIMGNPKEIVFPPCTGSFYRIEPNTKEMTLGRDWTHTHDLKGFNKLQKMEPLGLHDTISLEAAKPLGFCVQAQPLTSNMTLGNALLWPCFCVFLYLHIEKYSFDCRSSKNIVIGTSLQLLMIFILRGFFIFNFFFAEISECFLFSWLRG